MSDGASGMRWSQEDIDAGCKIRIENIPCKGQVWQRCVMLAWPAK